MLNANMTEFEKNNINPPHQRLHYTESDPPDIKLTEPKGCKYAKLITPPPGPSLSISDILASSLVPPKNSQATKYPPVSHFSFSPSSSVEVIINTYNIYMGAPLRWLLSVTRLRRLKWVSFRSRLPRLKGERSFLPAGFDVSRGC